MTTPTAAGRWYTYLYTLIQGLLLDVPYILLHGHVAEVRLHRQGWTGVRHDPSWRAGVTLHRCLHRYWRDGSH